MAAKNMSPKGFFRALAAGGIFLAGYYASYFLAGPEQLQQRLEAKASKKPAKCTALMERAFGFSYRNWVNGQRESGTDASAVQDIKPEIYLVESSIGMMEAKLGIADNAARPRQIYGIRRISSDIANKLGTNIACGNPEQSIDQFIGTIAEQPAVLENYPEKKAGIIRDYALKGMKEGMEKGAKGLYERMREWIRN